MKNAKVKETTVIESQDEWLRVLQILRDMKNVQCSDGNWNYDPYMQGMANGMIFSLSLFEAGVPQYLEAPETWLRDMPDTNELAKEESIATQQMDT